MINVQKKHLFQYEVLQNQHVFRKKLDRERKKNIKKRERKKIKPFSLILYMKRHVLPSQTVRMVFLSPVNDCPITKAHTA